MKKIGMLLLFLMALSCSNRTYNYEYKKACEVCKDHGGVMYTVKNASYLIIKCQDGFIKNLEL